jgi:hypothetical protein
MYSAIIIIAQPSEQRVVHSTSNSIKRYGGATVMPSVPAPAGGYQRRAARRDRRRYVVAGDSFPAVHPVAFSPVS